MSIDRHANAARPVTGVSLASLALAIAEFGAALRD